MQETICILYTAKPLTFLPERSILFMWLVIFNHKEVQHDTRRILGDLDPLSWHKPWGGLCILFEKVPERRHPARPHGLCAGVMVAASVWSLLIPAMEQAANLGRLAFFPAAVGFWLGILFLLLLDHLIPHLHQNSLQAEGPKSQLQRTTMMVLAVTLHNIPEGMAVGVVYAGYLAGTAQITAAGALALSLGIAIQNFPEGAIISMPLRAEGMKKGRAFWGGVLSGIVEPIGAVLTILAAGIVCLLCLSAQLCRRSHAVCGGGGTDPGNVAGAALQRRHGVFRGGLQRDDGAGRSTGVTVGVPESEISFKISENA